MVLCNGAEHLLAAVAPLHGEAEAILLPVLLP